MRSGEGRASTPKIRLSPNSISAVQKVITGDPLQHQEHAIAPYLTGESIIRFFEALPGVDLRDHTLGTRWRYVEEVLRAVNGTESMVDVLQAAVNPARFLHTDFSVDSAASYLDDYLMHDGYRLRRSGKRYRVALANDEVLVPLAHQNPLSWEAVMEQIEKAEDRIERDDFDGAITLARSLIETVLEELDERLPGEAVDAKGDLMRLYKAVQKKLALDPKAHDIESLQKILRGLVSIVDGLSGLRNRMGDAHARTFTAHIHHAVLAVNAARTLTMFLFASEQYQRALRAK